MKPNFALSLSFDGIRLMHRSGTGWTIVGDVALDTSDMAGELAMLRKTALALDPAGLRTKLLLPNDQIKYLALDTTRATEDDVKAKLDGATPYAVTDLVYDFVRGGGRTYIAAVARETLEEAEGFATEHRFGPVCFAGVPEEFTYVGEAFFGPTKASRTLLPAGETVERDASPVRVPTKAARPVVLPVGAPIGQPESAPAAPKGEVERNVDAPGLSAAVSASTITTQTPSAPLPVTAEPILSATAADIPIAPAPGTRDTVMASPEVITRADPAVAAPMIAASVTSPPPPLAGPSLAPPPEVDETPVFASRARSQKGTKGPGTSPVDLSTPVLPAASVATAPMQGAVLAKATAPEPAFARRAPDVLPGAAAPGTTATVAGPVAAAPIQTAESASGVKPAAGLAVPVGRPISAPPVVGTGRVTIDSAGLVPRGISATAAKPGVAPPVTGLSGAVRPNGTSPVLPKAGTVAAPVPARKPVLGDEAPFDEVPDLPVPAPDARAARTAESAAKAASRPFRRKPRFLGLILTVILVLVLFAVAAWATMTDTVLSRWFGSQDEPVVTASAVSVPIAIPLSDETALGASEVISPEQDAPAQSAPIELTLAEPGPEPALNDPATVDTATAADPMPADGAENALADLPAADLSDAVPLDAGAAAAAAAAVATAIAGLEATADPSAVASADAPTTAASPSLADPVLSEGGTVVTPEEAERFYAATGVWLRAPRLPLLPTAESLDGLYTAAVDGSLTDRPAAALQPMGADVGLVPQLNPPAPGTRFARDDRGFILATPEGTLTPDGMLVFAGQPAVVPPTRPGTVAPAALAADPAVPPAETVAQPVAPGTRPQARPESIAALAPAAEDQTAESEATATDPETADPTTETDPATAGGVTLASLRPQERPGDIVPPATPEVETVAFDGPRPATRPDGLAPEGATSTPDAELAEDETPTDPVPADPVTEVSAALAAIVDGAADPLAGATAQAVAVASRPDARPTNFSRVVEQQTARLARAQPATEAPAAASTAGDLSREEQAETEPEVASNAAAAPNGPIPGGVANAATFEDVMALREINLIGVYGQPSQRRALVRLANGRYLRVEVGDSLDGGQVAAISESALNYVRRGRTITLEIPGE